ncbi:MAG: transcriptional regulator [Sphingomonadaceae bacterium]|jgi:putative transcriptional regulator|nr:transcriptional regulator [Sphingomonadaceae bacterium]
MSEKDTIVRVDADAPVTDETDWEAFDALADDDVNAAARSDPDNRPATSEQLAATRRMPDVRAIRKAQGMSQKAFAERYELPVSVVRDWEQGRYSPPAAAITLLNVIEHHPVAVVEAIAAARRR